MPYQEGIVLVEGQTEEQFITHVLQPYIFGRCELCLTAKIYTTKKPKNGPHHKGGDIRFAKVKPQLEKLLSNTHLALVTTFFDFYGLGKDFPGTEILPVGDGNTQVAHLEEHFKNAINDQRFLPYIHLHEFEAFGFIDAEITDQVLLSPNKIEEVRRVRNMFKTPELINNSPETAPSKRLQRIYPKYNKITDGRRIAESIGIERIRKECPHFNRWIKDLIQGVSR